MRDDLHTGDFVIERSDLKGDLGVAAIDEHVIARALAGPRSVCVKLALITGLALVVRAVVAPAGLAVIGGVLRCIGLVLFHLFLGGRRFGGFDQAFLHCGKDSLGRIGGARNRVDVGALLGYHALEDGLGVSEVGTVFAFGEHLDAGDLATLDGYLHGDVAAVTVAFGDVHAVGVAARRSFHPVVVRCGGLGFLLGGLGIGCALGFVDDLRL